MDWLEKWFFPTFHPVSLGEWAIVTMSMIIQSQLLATKFYIPVAPGTLIWRPRLSGLLAESLKYPLTLISAPAGFGKTMGLSSWAQSLPASQALVAWISLDEEDNEPRLFWTYVLSALDQQQAERLTPLLKYLQSPEAPPLRYILTALINGVLDSQEHLVLILDDYHLITEPQVHATLSYLIEHLPPHLHIILATRADPPLALSQLRAHQQVLEICTEQLRCTTEETEAFFKESKGIHLPDDMIQEVMARTEGWLVGLHLLGLSLPEHANPATLLQEVSGDQRYILDYLTEAVLRQQPQEVQTFLLFTSILEQLNASLCNAVMQQSGSQQLLESLEHANLFVVSLDSRRQWYRYHALFAEALQHQLEQTHADLVPILHHRASLWYAEHGQSTQAIVHAFQAREWQWAAELLEPKLLPLTALTWGASRHKLVFLQKWLEQLPAEVMRARPQLCLASVLLLFQMAPYPLLKGWLDMAEATLTTVLSTQADEDGSSSLSTQENLLGTLIGYRFILSVYQEDGQVVLERAQQALALLSPENLVMRAAVLLYQGIAFYTTSVNDAVTAVETLLQAISLAQTAGQSSLTMIIMGSTAKYMLGAGQLHRAYRLTQQAIELSKYPGERILPEVVLATIFQVLVLCEWNQLDKAFALVQDAIALSQQSESLASLTHIANGYAALLHIALSRGNLEVARTAFQEFQGVSMQLNQPFYLQVRSHFTTIDQVRLWLACGELDRATRWAEELDMTERDGNPYVHEREEVARARVLLARALPRLALQRLEPVQQRATQGQRWGHVIEIRLLQALAHQMLHEVPQALSVLLEAIRLAEPEGYIRSFVDEGVPMQALLSQLREQQHKAGPTPYLDRLLAAFQKQSHPQKRLPKRRG